MKKVLLLILFIYAGNLLFAQHVTLPFERRLRIEFERELLDSGKNWHAIYPFRTDSIRKTNAYSDIHAEVPAKGGAFGNWVNRKLFYETFISLKKEGFTLAIDPMVAFEAGRQFLLSQDDANEEDVVRNTWLNTRGIKIDGTIGKHVAFHSAFYESQAVLPGWADKQTRSLRVVPGQAMYKNFKDTGFDFAFAEGHLSYSPSKYFNFRFGHGKNFIGDGYRSLLLSDVAYNYPYLAINTRVWNIEYVNIYSQLQDISVPKGDWHPWQKKYTTTHYLSWHILPWLTAGLFESIVWQASDSTGVRGFDVNYLNPVIFYRPVEFSLGSPDNALLGASLRFTIMKRNLFYMQLMLDEFKLEHVMKGDGWWANKHGFQVGLKSYDPFSIPNLYFQAEYNHVRPYTYAHNTSIQNYGHYNQPLAHPQGANFREMVVIADKRINRFRLGYKMVYVTYGADTAGLSYGRNIYRSYYDFVSEFGNKIGQGLKTTVVEHDFNAGWIVNPSSNLILSAGVTYRQEKSVRTERNLMVWLGIRSEVFNRYYDL